MEETNEVWFTISHQKGKKRLMRACKGKGRKYRSGNIAELYKMIFNISIWVNFKINKSLHFSGIQSKNGGIWSDCSHPSYFVSHERRNGWQQLWREKEDKFYLRCWGTEGNWRTALSPWHWSQKSSHSVRDGEAYIKGSESYKFRKVPLMKGSNMFHICFWFQD